jgi:hypothetical protein
MRDSDGAIWQYNTPFAFPLDKNPTLCDVNHLSHDVENLSTNCEKIFHANVELCGWQESTIESHLMRIAGLLNTICNLVYRKDITKTTFLLKIDIPQFLFSFLFVPTSRHECFRK